MKTESIIVIGGGIAGLMVASEVSDKFHVTMLEAQDRLGGRIHTLQPANGATIEAGAEFVHGPLPVTLKLLDEASIDYKPIHGNMYRIENGEWKEEEEMIEGWSELVEQMGNINEDMTMEAFLMKYFPDEKYSNLVQQVTAFTEGFDIADVKKVSVNALYNEWQNEQEPNFRITDGYAQLVNFLYTKNLKNHCTIHTSSPVLQIDWQPNKVTVVTKNGQVYHANKVVFTAPISFLASITNEVSINFVPEILSYREAAANIGFGAVVKVILGFKKSFWKDDTLFIFGTGHFPTWWTQLPNEAPVLVGWAGGPKASSLSSESDAIILENALQSLSGIFKISMQELKDTVTYSHVANWQKNPYSGGAYSYDQVGSKQARKLLNEPIENTIFFAGEALYDGNHPGTVEAALVSAKEVAKRILGF